MFELTKPRDCRHWSVWYRCKLQSPRARRGHIGSRHWSHLQRCKHNFHFVSSDLQAETQAQRLEPNFIQYNSHMRETGPNGSRHGSTGRDAGSKMGAKSHPLQLPHAKRVPLTAGTGVTCRDAYNNFTLFRMFPGRDAGPKTGAKVYPIQLPRARGVPNGSRHGSTSRDAGSKTGAKPHPLQLPHARRGPNGSRHWIYWQRCRFKDGSQISPTATPTCEKGPIGSRHSRYLQRCILYSILLCFECSPGRDAGSEPNLIHCNQLAHARRGPNGSRHGHTGRDAGSTIGAKPHPLQLPHARRGPNGSRHWIY